MHVLVTGGAGYIGSHAVEALVRAGHTVRILDNLSTGHHAAVPAGVPLIEGDLRDEPLLREALDGVDAVMHFAARSIVSESFGESIEYWHNNVTGSLSLLRAMRDQNVQRLIFSSTAATYGVPEKLPITEATPQQPINPYGQTKLAVERAILDACAGSELSASILRYFNVAGCSATGNLGEDHHPETHLIPLVLQTAAGQRASISIFGTDYPTPDGTCIRDYVHVEDLVSAHLAAMDGLRPGACSLYNVGIGKGYSVREVIDAAQRVTGVEFPVTIGARRQGDPPVLYTDPSRLKDQLGWQPKYTDIHDIVGSAWAWFRANPQGYGTGSTDAP